MRILGRSAGLLLLFPALHVYAEVRNVWPDRTDNFMRKTQIIRSISDFNLKDMAKERIQNQDWAIAKVESGKFEGKVNPKSQQLTHIIKGTLKVEKWVSKPRGDGPLHYMLSSEDKIEDLLHMYHGNKSILLRGGHCIAQVTLNANEIQSFESVYEIPEKWIQDLDEALEYDFPKSEGGRPDDQLRRSLVRLLGSENHFVSAYGWKILASKYSLSREEVKAFVLGVKGAEKGFRMFVYIANSGERVDPSFFVDYIKSEKELEELEWTCAAIFALQKADQPIRVHEYIDSVEKVLSQNDELQRVIKRELQDYDPNTQSGKR